ncbi:hypothetical protein AXG93_3036s1030 [Marchantia polymorpha subsp. ruderalis]|uniref:TAFII55 protein conserved region domain-containing protein n=1 Tax=Marchantia polymorpha subsp. ruderalis TaxID=1480154 RepID=A0A176WA40_MARPO|nr:hypothetical protein AXG93_3036s1030 [Marchantia polymorpha subsp. ruderalis]
MEEHFILRVPPSVAERLNRVLNEDPLSALDNSIDLSFLEDGRTGSFVIGKESFPASLLDLPCVVESYKTYDDNVLIKTADIGQIIMVGEPSEAPPEGPEYKHGLTPPMRDARRRRFRREPDLNLGLCSALTMRAQIVEQEEDADDDAEPEEAQPAANAGAVSEPAPASVISPIPEEPIGEDEEDEDDDAMDEDEDNENY